MIEIVLVFFSQKPEVAGTAYTGIYCAVATSNDKSPLNDKISLSVRLMI